jgi:hypothetical protein
MTTHKTTYLFPLFYLPYAVQKKLILDKYESEIILKIRFINQKEGFFAPLGTALCEHLM